MPEIFLASSALVEEDFEGKRTIEEASGIGFAGVQLFLDPRYRNPEYRKGIINMLKDSDLELIIHLPNEVEEIDKEAAEDLSKAFPSSKMLIHYQPTTSLPKIAGTKVGWENSLVGPLDETQIKHIERVQERVSKDDTFFVFDMGRLLYTPDEDTSSQETIEYIKQQIRELDPQNDVIHLADKESWVLKFRQCMCVLGEGVMDNFLEDIRNFEGPVVLEHEDLQMALDSLSIINN